MQFADIQIDLSLVDNEKEDIRRCLALLYSTQRGSCPLNRNFGIDFTALDMPIEAAKNILAADIAEQTAIHEPRVEVTEVEYLLAADGRLIPKVVVQYVND